MVDRGAHIGMQGFTKGVVARQLFTGCEERSDFAFNQPNQQSVLAWDIDKPSGWQGTTLIPGGIRWNIRYTQNSVRMASLPCNWPSMRARVILTGVDPLKLKACVLTITLFTFGTWTSNALSQDTAGSVKNGAQQAEATKKSMRLKEPILSSTVPDATKYLNYPNSLSFVTEQMAGLNGENPDIIFVGDSITQNWRAAGEPLWEKYFIPRHALDFGLSGDRTQNVLWRLNTYPLASIHPKIAVLLVGTNNTSSTPLQIAAGVQAVMDRLEMVFPGVKIIVTSIMPNGRANDLMMAANAMIKTAANGKTVFYLDLVPLMPQQEKSWKGLGPDRLHPDLSGYQIWSDALLPLIDKLLSAPE